MSSEKGVSPVIGTILLIAVTVIVAGVIAAFAMGLGRPKATPTASIYFDNIENGASGFYIYHDGGDAIVNAYSLGGNENIDSWNNLSLRIDGSVVGTTENHCVTGDTDDKFEVGEKITVNQPIVSDNRIVLIYAPTDSILQEITVP